MSAVAKREEADLRREIVGAAARSTEADAKIKVEYDEQPHATLDSIENAVKWLPRRLAAGETAAEAESNSPETIELLRQYLADNDLSDVRIVVNEYDPKKRFERLHNSRAASPMIRRTFGYMDAVGSSILPPRLLDLNVYDPATNTLYVNSDKPLDLLLKASAAKSLRAARYRDFEIFARRLPAAGGIYRFGDIQDTLAYSVERELWELEKATYRQACREVVNGATIAVVPFAPWYAIPVTHVAGTWVSGQFANQVIDRRDKERSKWEDIIQASYDPDVSDQ